MGEAPFRRTVTVLLVYAAGGWLVLVIGGWLRQVLVLPLIFSQLLRWGVFLGAGVAGAMAWFYPAIADSSNASSLTSTEDGDTLPSDGGRR